MAKPKSSGGAKAAPAAAVKAQKAETKKEASKVAAKKAATPNAREGRVADSKKQQTQKAALNLYKNVGINFIGAGVSGYLDKDGKVKTISSSSGPSVTGSGGSSGNTPMDLNPVPYNLTDADPVKIATRNVTNISSLVPQFNPEHIAKILFENVSAIELSIVERHDTIEGINQKYSIISNLSEVTKKYNASKQLSPMDRSKPLTSIYAINIQDKIPQEDYIRLEDLDSTYQYLDENNQLVTRERGYYYIDTNGDLVIELINLERSQEVEVYIDTNGTIYKVES